MVMSVKVEKVGRNAVRLVAVVLCLCVISGCGGRLQRLATASKAVTLTAENVSEYLIFSLRGYGSDYRIGYGGCTSLTVTGGVGGIEGYTYENVVVQIAVRFVYTRNAHRHTQWLSQVVTLDAHGNAVVDICERVYPAAEYAQNVRCEGYDVLSVSGRVVGGDCTAGAARCAESLP